MADPEREFENLTLEDYEQEKQPRGKNNLSSFAMFNERKKYKNEVYPIYTVPTPYDLWYDKDKHFFGKLDQNGYALVAREKYFKELPGSINSFALDFVVDAFNDFRDKYVFLNKKQASGTPFDQLNTKSAWRSSPIDYNNYLDGIFELFVNDFMTQNNRDQKMIDFRSFVSLFYKFVKQSEGNTPITFSSFVKSSFCSPQSSGLIIEVSNDPHGNDQDKYDNFIKNINFECYARTAAEFGFRIDKNYPGRLIADIKSNKMQEYMSKYPKEPKRPEITEPQPPVFELPDVGEPSLQSPWSKGDTVEAYLIRPKDPTVGIYYIIGGYTEPRNQKFGAGVRPIINTEVDGERVDAFQYMVNNLLPEGRATKVFFRLVDVIPPERPQPTVLSSNVPFDIRNALVTYSLAVPGGTKKAAIIGVENSFQGGLSSFITDLPASSFRYIDFQDYLENGLNSSYVVARPRDTAEGLFVSSLPTNSIHLSNAVQQPSSTIERFNQYYKERDDIKVEQERREEYRVFTYEPLYRKYEEELKIYNQTIEDYNAQVKLYNTLPKPMSFYNIIESRYNLGYRVDVNMLKEMLMQFYYSYSSSRPNIFLKEEVKCGTNTPRTKHKVIEREQISKNIIDQKFPDRRYWIKTYAEIKRIEMKDKISSEVFNTILYNTISLYSSRGEEESLKYLTDQFKKYD